MLRTSLPPCPICGTYGIGPRGMEGGVYCSNGHPLCSVAEAAANVGGFPYEHIFNAVPGTNACVTCERPETDPSHADVTYPTRAEAEAWNKGRHSAEDQVMDLMEQVGSLQAIVDDVTDLVEAFHGQAVFDDPSYLSLKAALRGEATND